MRGCNPLNMKSPFPRREGGRGKGRRVPTSEQSEASPTSDYSSHRNCVRGVAEPTLLSATPPTAAHNANINVARAQGAFDLVE